MAKKLKDYFPMIRSRKEVLGEISQNPKLEALFDSWEQEIHYGKVLFDTGLPIHIPQEYFLIPLDIFKRNMQNKRISNREEAWLSFLSFDTPERIMEIITNYPEFKPMYEEIYMLCQNVERVMDMYSKELSEIDRNTVQYMIEEQQETIEAQQETIQEQQQVLEETKETIEAQQQIMNLTLAMIEHGQAEDVKRLTEDPVFLQEMIVKYDKKETKN